MANGKRLLGVVAALMLNAVVQAAGRPREDAVLEWNEVAMEILNEQPPPEQMRFAAIVQLAVFEGVNAVTGDYDSTLNTLNAPRRASAEAAAVGAAHKVMRTYFPDQAAKFDAARERSLARIPDGPARHAGLDAGEAAAVAVMTAHENDGSDMPEFHIPGSANPGEWQPSADCPPNGGPYLHWSKVKTFVIRSPQEFRSAPPPALNSDRYSRAFVEVMENGARDSKSRPDDRTTVAQFYAEFGDAALWNPIARQLAIAHRQTLAENARVFALLNMALHDLAVALVETKYHYHFWRPETAIRGAGADGNDKTTPDASYMPLITTPCHPSYGSGHAATGGAAREVLARTFGERGHEMVVTHPKFPGVVLRYSTLEQVTRDIDDARVFGGIHFRFDQEAGADQGHHVGAYVWKHALAPVERQCRTSSNPKLGLRPVCTGPRRISELRELFSVDNWP
jgi:hypothetical protein